MKNRKDLYMHLIIGGAYQGKVTFAKEHYKLTEHEICCCTQDYIDFSKPCLAQIEEFTYGCVRRGQNPVTVFQTHQKEWADCILICNDIFCGVVPMGADMRRWREITGELCQYLSKEADKVSRIFCGLEQRLK